MNHAIFWVFQSYIDNIFVGWTRNIKCILTFCPPSCENKILKVCQRWRFRLWKISMLWKENAQPRFQMNTPLSYRDQIFLFINYKNDKSHYIQVNTTELYSVKAKGTERDHFSYSALKWDTESKKNLKRHTVFKLKRVLILIVYSTFHRQSKCRNTLEEAD